MSPHIIIPIARPVKSRWPGQTEVVEECEDLFLLAVSRAFLASVNAHDRNAAMLYSRAILSIVNKGAHKVQ